MTCVPGGYLSYRNGFKAILGLGVLANSLSTMLSPFCLDAALPWIIALRSVAGAAEGVVLPAGAVSR